MNCWLCSVALTLENDSKEHVIPQAIGGRKTVSGFICRRCNNETGTEWDAGMIRFLEFFTVIENPSRADGKTTPPITSIGNDGLEYLVHPPPPGKPLIPVMKHPYVKETMLDEDGVRIEGKFESETELRNSLEKMKKRRYPDLDVEQVVANANWTSKRPTLTNTIEWNPNCEKSVAKIALALACSNGIDKEECQQVIDYLNRPYSPQSANFVRPFDSDWPITIPKGRWHHIFISGLNGLLVGYVKYYDAMSFCVILSRDYKGEFVAMSYSVDPGSGIDIDRRNWREVFGLDESVLLSLQATEVGEVRMHI